VLAEHERRWVIVGQLPEAERQLPQSVRSMVDKKISQLDDADRRLLTAGSVQGYEFDSAVVSKALSVDAADAEDRFDVLDGVHGLVTLVGERELPDRTLTLRYRFVHVLYQNALYASLRPTRKVALSTAVANALLEYFGAHRSAIAAELAMLFEAARDFDRAAEFFQLAAEQAARVSANKEAVVLARRGLNALGLLPQTQERAQQELRLQTILGPALMATAGIGVPEVEAVYVRAQALCQQVGETPQRFTVMFGLFQYWIARGDYRTCEELAGQLLALAQKLRDPSLLLIAHNAVGNTFGLSGEPERAAAHNHQAIAIYVAGQHHSLASFHSGWDPGVACRSALAKNLWILGYPDQAFRAGEDAVAFARELAHSYSMVFALIYSASLHQHRRDAPRTRQQAEAAIALAAEQELPLWLPWAGAMHGWAMAEQGHAEEGIAELVQAIARWKAIRSGALTPYFLELLAEAYAKNGQAEASLAALAEALEITARTHEGYVEAELYRLKGELQVDPAEAEVCFRQAIDVARRQKAKSFELRAATSLSRFYHQQGRDAEAHRMLSEIYGWFTEGFDTPDLKDAATLLEELQS
jgi:predicted ATPase